MQGLFILDRVLETGSEDARKDEPGKRCLGCQAKDDIDSFAIEIVCPLANFFVLQNLVYSETIEENEDREVNPIDEIWSFVSPTANAE